MRMPLYLDGTPSDRTGMYVILDAQLILCQQRLQM